jgi:hypothetical protein
MSSRKARRSRQEPPCFEGSETVSRFRPFFRRRESTARPQREAMRARNPCLLIRRLLRGRYDGFMKSCLQSEPGKLVRRRGESKTRRDGRTTIRRHIVTVEDVTCYGERSQHQKGISRVAEVPSRRH